MILSLNDEETGRRLSIEFCAIASGGGRNPVVFKGLQKIVSDLTGVSGAKNKRKKIKFASHCPNCGKGTNEGGGTGKYQRFYGEGPQQIRYKCKKCGHEWHNYEGAVEC